jgi:hypothetical protein
MAKINNENSRESEQSNYMRERVRNLENDLEKALREKTDAGCEVRRLGLANEALEKQI